MKNWSVQTQSGDGFWFYQAGDLLESDARYWFDVYRRRFPNLRWRVCQASKVEQTFDPVENFHW